MKKKHAFAWLGAASLTIVVLNVALALSLAGGGLPSGRMADLNDPYSLTFDEESARPEEPSADGSLTAETGNGNEIRFDYRSAAPCADGFIALEAGGTFLNPFLPSVERENAISGITRIKAVFSGGHLAVYYAWDEDFAAGGAGYQGGNALTSGEYFAFDALHPTYLMIFNDGDTEVRITSIYIGYSCEREEGVSAAMTGSLTFERSADNNAYTVTKYAGGDSSVRIPAFHRDAEGSPYLPVTAIGSKAFENCSSLASISFPATLKSIDEQAFWHCAGLTSFHVPAGVESIGPGVLGDCGSLASITVDPDNRKYHSSDDAGNPCDCIMEDGLDGNVLTKTLVAGCKNSVVPKGVTAIGTWAFFDCSDLTSIAIPASVVSIGKYAFQSCEQLASVTFGGASGLELIDDRAFLGCSTLASIAIPDSVVSIGKEAFENCERLASVTFGEGSRLELIDDYAFISNSALTSIDIPASVISLGIAAFQGCDQLATVTFRAGSRLEVIGPGAFCFCPSLRSMTIPDNVTLIDDAAFKQCTSLSWVVFPASLEKFGPYENIFSLCRPGLIIYYKGTTIQQWNGIDGHEPYTDMMALYSATTPPGGTGYRYWHYTGAGMPILW